MPDLSHQPLRSLYIKNNHLHDMSITVNISPPYIQPTYTLKKITGKLSMKSICTTGLTWTLWRERNQEVLLDMNVGKRSACANAAAPGKLRLISRSDRAIQTPPLQMPKVDDGFSTTRQMEILIKIIKVSRTWHIGGMGEQHTLVCCTQTHSCTQMHAHMCAHVYIKCHGYQEEKSYFII